MLKMKGIIMPLTRLQAKKIEEAKKREEEENQRKMEEQVRAGQGCIIV